MPFPRMQREESRPTPRGEQARIGRDRAAQLAHIIAEHLAEAAGLEKVALHIDDQRRAGRRLKREWIGLCDDFQARTLLATSHDAPRLRSLGGWLRASDVPDRNARAALTRSLGCRGERTSISITWIEAGGRRRMSNQYAISYAVALF